MWVTFDVFTCNRMIKLKIASKRSEPTVTLRWQIWKLEHLVNTPWLAILMITVCWGNWNVSPHAGTFHLTCTVMCYEITLEKCMCVGRTIVNTVPPRDKSKWFPVSMNIWEKLWWYMTLLSLGCIGSDDCNVSFSFQTFNFVSIVAVYHIYFLYLHEALKSWSKRVNNLTSFVWKLCDYITLLRKLPYCNM